MSISIRNKSAAPKPKSGDGTSEIRNPCPARKGRCPKSEIKALRAALIAFIAARIALSAWAWLILQINPLIVSNLDLFGEKVVVAFDLQTGQRAVFARVLCDTPSRAPREIYAPESQRECVSNRELHFRPAPPNLVDVETNRVWDLRGRAETGEQLAPSRRTAEEIFPYHGVVADTRAWLSVWQRFDTNWYLAIAQFGYGKPADVHFPPLYPALVRIGSLLVGGDDLLSAWLISNLALAATLAVLYRHTAQIAEPTTAARAIAYLVLFPTGFFLFAPYTESLFLLFTVLLFDSLARGRLHWAGFWAFLGVLTRLQGIALVVPIAIAWYQSKPRSSARGIFAVALPSFALGIYLALRATIAPVGAIPTSEPDLHARLVPPWENYWYAIQTIASGQFLIADALNFVVTTLCVIVLVIGWRQLPLTHSLFAVASLVVVTMRWVDTQPLNSMVRYALTLFPVFVLLARFGKNAWVNRAVVYLSFALALFLCGQFVMWGWVG